uniref:UDP-glucuronate decarboxylase n=1 Tax=Craspedostauros australis TaxID=1486917 RepID=A0A7R9WU30_9STRA
MVARKRVGATAQLPVVDGGDASPSSSLGSAAVPAELAENGTKGNTGGQKWFSKQSLMILTIGMLTGYVILPMALVEVNISDYLKTDAVETMTPRVRSLESFAGVDEVDVLEQVKKQQMLLSRQSLPTWATPNVMETKVLPDHKRKKILVTGGAGFVGSHLVDKLMMEGHEVTVIDNLFTGQKKNIAHWLQHPNFTFKIHDVTEPLTIEVAEIYHLACPASPPHYQYNPVKTIKTSTEGTLNMLGLAKRLGAKILLTSTSEIYGDPKEHPQKETYWGNVNTIGPRSCYDEGKRVAETMMYSYQQQNNVNIRIARIFNTFGPRMHPNDGRVVSNFIIQALQGKPMTIYGDGSQTRSFQYVSDLVDGLHALMNHNYDGPVNLGNPDEYTVKNFAEHIKEITKSESEIMLLQATRDDPTRRQPDISTAAREIGWKPVRTVDEGLRNTIEYFAGVLKMAGGEIIPTGPGASKPQA